MNTWSGDVNDVYEDMVHEVLDHGQKVCPRGTTTLEVHPVMVELVNPHKRLVSSFGRSINVTFALAEVLWILAGREDVEMLEFYNGNIKNFSDNGETFNAPYGYRLRGQQGHDQIADAVEVLKADPDSRQAVLQVWDSRLDLPVVNGNPNNTKDRACNVLAHLMIRDDALDWLQVVRSNDLIWGTPYNWMQWMHLQEYVANLIGVAVGHYYHVADSLHIYDYHWSDAEAITNFDIYQHLPPHSSFVHHDLDMLQSMEKLIREGELMTINDFSGASRLPDCWKAALTLFVAHAYYVNHDDSLALSTLIGCPDPVYAAAQARFYWDKRWHKTAGTVPDRIRKWLPAPVAEWALSVETA